MRIPMKANRRSTPVRMLREKVDRRVRGILLQHRPFHSRVLRTKAIGRQVAETLLPRLKRKRLARHRLFFQITRRLAERTENSFDVAKEQLKKGIFLSAQRSIESRMGKKNPPALSPREAGRIGLAITILQADLANATEEVRTATRYQKWLEKSADRNPKNPRFTALIEKNEINLDRWIDLGEKLEGRMNFLRGGLREFGGQ